jgi:hypothetical protein
VSPKSGVEVWWRCRKDRAHVWKRTIRARTHYGSACPLCPARAPRRFTAPLATTHPDVAAEWHPTKNRKLRPEDLTAGSNARVWWRCSRDPRHVWEAFVATRSLQRRGCPYCGRRRASAEVSLKVCHPRLAREWHPRKNGALRPRDVLPKSTVIVWWQCPRDPRHAWRASVQRRAASGSDCPHCFARIPLSRSHPAIAREWHAAKNAPLTAADVTHGSRKRVYWRCTRDRTHVWQCAVGDRVRTSGCPIGAWTHAAREGPTGLPGVCSPRGLAHFAPARAQARLRQGLTAHLERACAPSQSVTAARRSSAP